MIIFICTPLQIAVLLIAESDEVNIVACLAAHALFAVPTKIARVHSPHYFVREKLFAEGHMPIDVFITPEQLISDSIQHIIECPGALQVLNFANEQVKIIATKPTAGGALVGKSLGDLHSALKEVDIHILAIFRNNHPLVLKNSSHITVGDEIFFITTSESVAAVMATLHKSIELYKRVMIIGGGRIGLCLAESLQENYQVKIIEQHREQCEMLAQRLNARTTILHGSAGDQELLLHENIQDMDVFCAMTNDDEDNIMSCLQAKRLGAKFTIALIKRAAYADMIEGSGIDVVISPHQVMIGSILTHIRLVHADVVNIFVLRRGATEAIEMVVNGDEKSSKVVGRCLADIDMPQGATIAGILRNKVVIIPTEETIIATGDHIILFVTDKRRIRDIEKIFG